jgi:hypothetical protein
MGWRPFLRRSPALPDFRVDGMCAVPLYVDVKGHPLENEERDRATKRMEIIWSSEPNVALAIWTADLFGLKGLFDVLFPDGWRVRARVGRCGPCGNVTFRPTCRALRASYRTTEPAARRMNRLIANENP